MEFFSEIYGSYYSAVAAVLEKAAISPLSEKEITDIISENAFSRSVISSLGVLALPIKLPVV